MDDSGGLPRISIVTPSFNQGPFLERTIRSVLDQHYPNLEYIVIDGGSDDGSVEIIRKYQDQIAYWVSERDRGQSSAINKGLARATGAILSWLNSDDYYLPATLQTIGEAALANSEAGAFVGGGEIVDEFGNVIYHRDAPPEITLETLYHWNDGGDFIQPSCFFRGTAWRDAGPLDETVHIAFDVDFWMRMAKAGHTFVPIDHLLSQALSHRQAKTTAHRNLMFVDFSIVAIRHGGEHVVRRYLEDMAIRLSWAEPNLQKILDNRIVKLLTPLLSRFVTPAVHKRETVPRWLKS